MLRCRLCICPHTEKALEVGASKATVAEALRAAWVLWNGAQVEWKRDDFEQHHRIIETAVSSRGDSQRWATAARAAVSSEALKPTVRVTNCFFWPRGPR